jgi:hypothetical protein
MEMSKVEAIVKELGAKSATDIEIKLVVGYTKPAGPPLYEAVVGGKHRLVAKDEAIALRRQGARTEIPDLKSIDPD